MNMTRQYSLIIALLAALLLSACFGGQFASLLDADQRPVPTLVQKQSAPPVDVATKKADFFAAIKPAVVQENKRIRALREEIFALRQLRSPSSAELQRIKQVAAIYKVELTGNKPDGAFWHALLARVDEVPLEMALVQAANESAWGQSRFAREGNNYYGQWCYKKGCGLVPEQRNKGATHEVRRFASMEASVRAYMQNINTSAAYAEFRSIRQSLRVQSRPLDAESLAYGLRSYSERGMAYVKTIRAMIRSNRELIANS
ncbi:MAG: flagellar biosynthesis protein FlgJ [Zetaproteobacteria bacterium CG_4_9_14_3_um_filter_54_145]|nr:MAG: flagellar biosynthesis protein FlgJ [Zetaproteobacteria bacterium CG_4_10_14_3_um_filter_54_28]PJA29916.1 MAG: flagellar biosynthesis protein FlgJ [Zetaproteobacteria bacterium CG_4_9_14_3_um_filter_54_145]